MEKAEKTKKFKEATANQRKKIKEMQNMDVGAAIGDEN